MDKLPIELIRYIKEYLPVTRKDWRKGSYLSRAITELSYLGYPSFKEQLFMCAYYHYIRLSFGNTYIDPIDNYTPAEFNVVNYRDHSFIIYNGLT